MDGHGDIAAQRSQRAAPRIPACDVVEEGAASGDGKQGNTASPLAHTIGAQQHIFAERLARVNVPGNLEGLFAQYVIGDDRALPFEWQVACLTNEWLSQHAHRAMQTHIVAAIGYGLHAARNRAPATAMATFDRGVTALRQRDPFPEDRVSFAYQPITYLGVALGAVALGEPGIGLCDWLHITLQRRLQQEVSPFQRLLFAYIDYVLTRTPAAVTGIGPYRSADDLAALL